MEFYESLAKLAIIMTCVTLSAGFVLVKSERNEDDKSIETRVVYLINLLEKLKDITEPDYDGDDVTSFNQFDVESFPGRDEVPTARIQQVDDTHTRMIDIRKKDFAILPPANEWCRMMGFRRCRQSHS